MLNRVLTFFTELPRDAASQGDYLLASLLANHSTVLNSSINFPQRWLGGGGRSRPNKEGGGRERGGKKRKKERVE